MVCVNSTVKLFVTLGAALYVVLPACEAVMLHVPPVTSVAVLPETVQTVGVVEANETASPELAVAESVTVPPAVWVGIVANVIVCATPWFTVIVCPAPAMVYVALPVCNATIVQEPGIKKVAIEPEVVQTLVVNDVNWFTVSPDEAETYGARFSDVPEACGGTLLNVTVCDSGLITRFVVTCGAALYVPLPA